MVQNSDIGCPKSHCPFNNSTAKILIQKIIVKDFCPKDLKVKKIISVYANVIKPLKQDKKDNKNKKKRFGE